MGFLWRAYVHQSPWDPKQLLNKPMETDVTLLLRLWVWSKQDSLLAFFDKCVTCCAPGNCWLFVERMSCYFAPSRWHIESVKKINKEQWIQQKDNLFFSTSQLRDLLSTILLSRAFTSQLYNHSHSFFFFFLNSSWQCVCAILALPCIVAISQRKIWNREALCVKWSVMKKNPAGWHCLKSLWQLQTCVCNREMEHRKEIKTHAGCYSHQINVTNTMKGTFGLTRKILEVTTSADGTQLH